MAAAIGALGALGNLGQSGFNMGTISKFGSQYMSQQNQQDMQREHWQQANQFEENNFNRNVGAFTKYGLPEFMAQQGAPKLPPQYFHLGGTNFQQSGYAGMNMPPQTNNYQQMMKWGTPQQFNRRFYDDSTDAPDSNLKKTDFQGNLGPPPPYSPPDGGLMHRDFPKDPSSIGNMHPFFRR